MKIKKTKIRERIIPFALALAASIISIFIAIILKPILGDQIFFFSLIAVVSSVLSKNIKAGLTTTFLNTLGITYIYSVDLSSGTLNPIIFIIQIFIFLLSSVFLLSLADKIKNTNEVLAYKKREKEYLELIEKMKLEKAEDEKKIRARDEFLSIASHELKTPLSSMLLQVQMAIHNIRNVSLAQFSVEKLMKMLQSTEQQTHRLSKMINDLLNVSLITTGRLELEKERCDLKLLVKGVIERFHERIKKEKYHVKFESKSKIIGNWDKLRIEQVVGNLISNAIKYGDGKPIEIKVVKSGSNAKITVVDQGIGVPQDIQKKIFERFQRGVSNQDYRGLGVGLYIATQIVKAHSGKIYLSSKLGKGSTFTVELPL